MRRWTTSTEPSSSDRRRNLPRRPAAVKRAPHETVRRARPVTGAAQCGARALSPRRPGARRLPARVLAGPSRPREARAPKRRACRPAGPPGLRVRRRPPSARRASSRRRCHDRAPLRRRITSAKNTLAWSGPLSRHLVRRDVQARARTASSCSLFFGSPSRPSAAMPAIGSSSRSTTKLVAAARPEER